MKISKKDLLAALGFPAQLACGRKSSPILNCVFLEASGGKLTIRASDIASHVSLQADCDGDLSAACVPASRIVPPLVNASSESISIEIENGMLRLDVGDEIKLATLAPDDFPKPPEQKGKNIGIDCKTLSGAISGVKWAASVDKSREAIQCVNVESSAKSLLVQATNGRQMAMYQEPLLCAPMDISIPSQYCGALASFLAEEGAILHLTERATIAIMKRGFYSCQLLESRFPNSSMLRNAAYKKIGVIKRDELLTKFKTITGCCSETVTPKVIGSFSKTSAKFAMVNSAETFSGSIAGNFSEAEVGLNASAFADCLSCFESGSEITLSHDPITKILLQCGNLSAISTQLL